MKNDAAWLRAMGRTLLRVAETPARKRNNDTYTALRGLAITCAAIALKLEDDDCDEEAERELERELRKIERELAEFTAEQPTEPAAVRTRVGVLSPTKGP